MQKKQFFLVAIYLACATSWCFGANGTLPKPVYNAAINPETGEIATVCPIYPEVLLYSHHNFSEKSPVPSKTCTIEGKPFIIRFKKYKDMEYFIVLARGTSRISLIDAKTFKLKKNLPVLLNKSGTGVFHYFSCSQNPDDPFVYFSYPTQPTQAMKVLDLRDLSILDVPIPKKTPLMHVEISPNGKLACFAINAFGRERGIFNILFSSANKPSGFQLKSPRDVYPNELRPFNCPDPMNLFLTDQFETRYHIGGGRSYHVSRMSEYPAPIALWKRYPLIFTKKGSQVIAISRNSFEERGQARRSPLITTRSNTSPSRELTGELKKAMAWTYVKRNVWPETIISDEKHEELIFFQVSNFQTLSLSAFGTIPKESWLNCTLEKTDMIPGEPNIIPVEKNNSKANLRLFSGPSGMTLEDGKLSWTPSNDQLGIFKVDIQIAVGRVFRTKTFFINVARPGFNIARELSNASLSPDGRYLLSWGYVPDLGSNSSARTRYYFLQLYDMETKTLLCEKEVPYELNMAAVDQNGIYLRPGRMSRLNCLSLEDLSLKKQIMLPPDTSSITLLGNNHLALSRFMKNQTLILDTQTMKIDRKIPSASKTPVRTNQFNPKQWGWRLGGLIYSSDLELQYIDKFQFYNYNPRYMPPRFHHQPGPPISSWGISSNAKLRQIFQKHGTGIVLESMPAVAILGSTTVPIPGERQDAKKTIIQLKFLELTEGEVVKTVDLQLHEHRSGDPRVRAVWERGNKVICMVNTRVYEIPLNEELKTKFALPPMIYFTNTKPIELKALRTRVKVKTTSRDLKFAKSRKRDSIEVPSNGSIQLNRTDFSQNKISSIKMSLLGKGTEAAEAQMKRNDQAKENYEKLFGVKPPGVPFVSTVTVYARDDKHTTNPQMPVTRQFEFDVVFFIRDSEFRRLLKQAK